MRIDPVGPAFGARITGVDLANLDDREFHAIRAALAEHQVLIIPEQAVSTEAHMIFGRRFGELSVSPFSPSDAAHAELIVLDNHADGPRPLTDIWHSDETFRACPPLTTILRARIVPAYGGDTLFASMTAAYEGLSDRMKAYVSGMTAVHGFGRFGEMLRADPERRHILHRVENELERPHHPVVRTIAETGKRALFVNAHFTERLDGVGDAESAAVLDFLFRQPQVPEYQLRVSWKPDTFVLWDNRAVQHFAPNDYLPQRRRMERVTVRGDRVTGDQAALPFGDHARGMQARHRGATTVDDSGLEAPVREFDRSRAPERQ